MDHQQHLRFPRVFRTVAALLLLVSTLCVEATTLRTCEPIRINMCRGLGYNMTGMPNLGGNELQQEAEYYLTTFTPLIQYGCSSHLKLFLCSVYVPMCTEKVAKPIGPCRGLCESVRSRCYPVLHGFGFPWPDALNCSHFPEENNHVHMCMEGPRDMVLSSASKSNDQPMINAIPELMDCPQHHVKIESGQCVPICDTDYLFDAAEKKFAEVWVTVWALICLVSSVTAALTLCIGGGRARARPLVFLALCYCFVSGGWTVRTIAGRSNVSCQSSEGDVSQDGLANANCAFVFLLIYYFGMAANAWWVSICIWWLAKAGLGWSPEKLGSLSSFLHVASWGLPAAQTVGALVRRDVDTDELTGTCYVGNKNDSTLLFLVLIPQAVYLSLGVGVLIVGCLKLLKKPRTLAVAAPLTGTAPRKDSDILGALATLYVIPTACVLASICYEYNNRSLWYATEEKPVVWAFLLRHLMSLFIGVSTFFWLWSKKTLTAWKAVARRMGPRKPLAVKTLPVRYNPPPPPPAAAHSHIPSNLSTTMSTASRHSRHSHRKPRVHHHRSGSENIL
ncbi:PREDICTED: frizzled-4-like [Nicrophorus vespilloides]|uniref:Frizzled-4 n=1 Tax=Nicrophorus vespilloides TaxID=110193 RepID=A0ABM1N6T9_NICVS|nr:PREDICTED: frizzled-4-like [Nicrophorus vespilloides]